MNELRINRNLARWILLGLGVVALIVMAVALLATPMNKFDTVSYVALGVAILGLAGFVLLDPQALVASVTGRTSQYGVTTVLMSLIFIVLVVALFILVREAKISPWDLTEAQKYQLSQQSIDLLADLKDDIRVTGFYTDQQSEQRQEAEIWLQQYEKYSNGKITYEFVDPDRDPLMAERLKMTNAGVMVFSLGEQTAEAGYADERSLTTALVRVLSGEARQLYMITGHGERSADGFTEEAFSQARTLLQGVGFEVKTLNLLQDGSVPEDASLVMVAGPTAQFAPSEIEALRAYLDSGGAALFMFDPGAAGGQLGDGLMSVAFNSDGSRLVTAGSDGIIKVWNARSGEQTLEIHGHTSSVIDAIYSPDNKQIVSASLDGTVRVWDAGSGEQVQQLEGQTTGVRRLAFSPDGRLLASAGESQAVNVWNARTLDPMSYSPIGVVVPLYAVAFSPDSSLVVAAGGSIPSTGSGSGIVYAWQAQSGEKEFEKTLHTNVITNIAFSADGTTLHSVAWDGTAGVLDIASEEGTTETLYPGAGITGLVVKADGTRVYSLVDGTIHIRPPDATSTAQDVVMTGHTDRVWSLRLSPDGDMVATASRDGSARLWSTETPLSRLTLAAQSGGDPLFNYLASSWGIQVADDVVVDLAMASNYGELVPIYRTFEMGSPIVQPLTNAGQSIVFAAARSIQLVDPAPADMILTPLVSSSSGEGASWGETQPELGNYTFDPEEDSPGPRILGVSAQNTITKSRVVVYGDADFASDGLVGQFGNSDLLVNSANWLTESEDLIDIPVKDVGSHTMDKPLSQAGLTIFSVISICLIPLLAMAAGVAVWFIRRRRR